MTYTWIKARHLVTGDVIRTDGSAPATVTAVQTAPTSGPRPARVSNVNAIAYATWRRPEESRCPVCEESGCEDPDEGPSAYCTRPGCGAAHDEHADDDADHCGTFTLVVDPTVDEE